MPDVVLDYHRLKTPIDHPDGSITIAKLGFGTLKKVAEISVTSDVTQITITGLDINTDKFYLIIGYIKNPTASLEVIALYVEGDTTSTNYYNQDFYVSGSSTGAGRGNSPYILDVSGGSNVGFLIFLLRDTSGYPRACSISTQDNVGSILIRSKAWTKTATVTNITRIDLVASVTNGIGAGSRIIIYGGW
jgi:hypothetical protein